VYFEVRNEFYKDTNGAILVFDVANRASFDNLEKWIDECKALCKTPVFTVLVANKVSHSEISQTGRRIVPRRDIN